MKVLTKRILIFYYNDNSVIKRLSKTVGIDFLLHRIKDTIQRIYNMDEHIIGTDG